jgi:1,6-anhydro-N-acetylmuramate kinase
MAERMITAIGLTRASAREGIDIALIATDGETRIVRRQSLTFPQAAEPQTFVEFCAAAVQRFLESEALARDRVALIGLQEADAEAAGEELARATGIDVVYDFGGADREAGGKGRPLEPVYHRALADAAGLARPLAVVEIGEEARVVFIGEDGSLSVHRVAPSAERIVQIGASLPASPLLWLLAGEEARIAALFDGLARAMPSPVHRAAEMGWSAEHFGAEASAYLAVRSLRRLPLTFPGTTGVRQALTGGRLARAPRR